MARNQRRIFIDCSFIDFSKQPTGIPRVVLSYIEVGYRWGQRHGVDVIPVIPTDGGLIMCRPMPGSNPPDQLVERVEESNRTHVIPAIAQAVSDLANYFAGIAVAVAGMAAAILPAASIRALVASFDTSLKRLANRAVERRATKADDIIRMVPGRGDLIFAPAYWHDVDPKIYRRMKRNGAKVVILVHDILPILFAKFYNSPWRYEFKGRVLQTTTYADALFCVSDFTKHSLLEFLARQKRRIPDMLTAYNGFEPLVAQEGLELITSCSPSAQHSKAITLIREREPFIMVGSVEPKKGHIPTIMCFEAMWAAGLDRNLVIIGRKGWMADEIGTEIENSIYFGDKLHWFSGFDDFDLAAAYIHSRALVMSSLAEGFGIPMIEATYYGKPAMVFDTPIAREIVGQIGLFFTDAASLVAHIQLLQDEHKYETACARAATFHWPSWDEYTPGIFDKLATLIDSDETIRHDAGNAKGHREDERDAPSITAALRSTN